MLVEDSRNIGRFDAIIMGNLIDNGKTESLAAREDFFRGLGNCLTDSGTLWLQLPFDYAVENRDHFLKNLGLKLQFDNCLVVNYFKADTQRGDWVPYTKADTLNPIYHSCEYLREVIATFTLANGVKRGWDYHNGMPARFAGLGNTLSTSDPRLVTAIMLMTSSNVGSEVYTIEGDIAVTLGRNSYLGGHRDEEIAALIKEHLSTHEAESEFSIYKRSFMPASAAS